jgi:hypothetical protein
MKEGTSPCWEKEAYEKRLWTSPESQGCQEHSSANMILVIDLIHAARV